MAADRTKVLAITTATRPSPHAELPPRSVLHDSLGTQPGWSNVTRLSTASRDERLIVRRLDRARAGTPTFAANRAYYLAKRLLDLTVALAVLALLSPILLLVALLVRLESGSPVLFIQRRIGREGRVFGMWKFRTMAGGALDRFDEPVHKLVDDPRLTRVGRILRRTSLDELPQLINVLRGDMSLVGPRPEIVEIALAHYEPWQYRRLLVPQGMTGWWQVTGRGTKLLREHTEDDLYYIEHASFWFDLKILVMTVQSVLRREGAF